MNKLFLKYFACFGLLACLFGHVLIVPLVLMKKLDNEANIHTSSLETSIEDTENPDRLSIKIGMALPYSGNWEESKESEGLIEHNGDFYTLISRDYKNDTLYFEYLKNSNAREIFSMLSDHVDPNSSPEKQANDFGSTFCKWLTLKYKLIESPSIQLPLEWILNPTNNFSYFKQFSSPYLGLSSPPPQSV